MPTKIRLQRRGKKKYAFFHVVIADSRAPRDGKFIEKLGTYNPNTNPATIDINFDKALHWVRLGAQPTESVRALLSYKGVLMRNHLDVGVKKGALTQEEADKKFEAWTTKKQALVQTKIENLKKQKETDTKVRLTKEKESSDKKLQAILEKNKPIEEKVPAKEVATKEKESPKDTNSDKETNATLEEKKL